MTISSPACILIADTSDVTRGITTSILQAAGYQILQAVDGASAIKVVQEHTVDLVIFDNIMTPVGGFELAHYIQGTGSGLPMILITHDQTSDYLQYAASLHIRHIMTKPADPKRLLMMVEQILSHPHKNRSILTVSTLIDREKKSPDQLMQHAIFLARKNFIGGFGGPFAAVIADPNGYLIGEGVNLPTSRFDPIAHAEVMAIRKAVDFLDQPHLEHCTLYSTSEPTRMAMALIESVGITQVYFGLSHQDMKQNTKSYEHLKIRVERLGGHDVQTMLKEIGYV